MCVNARSIVNKIDDLQALISVENPDIFGITESWTHEGILDAELSVNGYTLFRCDRPLDNRGGGVLLYVRSGVVNITRVNTIQNHVSRNKSGVS